MKPTASRHPDADALAAFARGQLAAQERDRVEDHVAACEHCCRRLGSVADDTFVQRLRLGRTRADTPVTDQSPPELPPELRDHPRYRIVRVLGAGGMGVVYQAEHRLLERPVALKVMSPDLVSNALAVGRFRQEVKAAGQLSHPNIIQAHDAEQAGDHHFLVMEYVDGTSLAALVEREGPLPPDRARDYVRQAAQGLVHAHERGMVHRDIKPHNLMVTTDGRVKILDFGLASLAREQPAPGRRLTALGTVLGTPDYIAPEQFQDSRRADARSDVYSLGCTLYYLLAGRPPFPGSTAMEKMLSHVDSRAEPLEKVRPEVGPALSAVVARMMAKDPKERPASMAEVAMALEPESSATIVAPPASVVAEPPAVEVPVEIPRPRRRKGKERRPASWGRRQLLWYGAATALGLIALVMLVAAWAKRGTTGGAAPPRRERVAVVIGHRGFYYPDYRNLKQALEAAGVDVEPACWRTGEAEGVAGKGEVVSRIPVTRPLRDLRADDFDAVVICGGWGVSEYLGDGGGVADIQRFLADLKRAGKPRGAICWGPAVLAEAGELRGLRVTCDLRKQGIDKKIQAGGATLTGREVEVEGDILTGRDEYAAAEFARRLVEVMRRRR